MQSQMKPNIKMVLVVSRRIFSRISGEIVEKLEMEIDGNGWKRF